MPGVAPQQFRTLFISDVHLGSKAAKAEFLIDFLRYHEAETIYLVGDIVDGWRLRRTLALAAEPQRRRAEAAAPGAQGRQHHLHRRQPRRVPAHVPGHAFRRHRRLPTGPSTTAPTAGAISSSMATSSTPSCTTPAGSPISATGPTISPSSPTALVTRARRMLGLPYWSFSSWAKVKVKKAVNFIGAFQDVLAEEARRSAVDGVICGHIHHAAIETLRRHRATSTPATGSKAARRWSSISTARMEILHWPHVLRRDRAVAESWCRCHRPAVRQSRMKASPSHGFAVAARRLSPHPSRRLAPADRHAHGSVSSAAAGFCAGGRHARKPVSRVPPACYANGCPAARFWRLHLDATACMSLPPLTPDQLVKPRRFRTAHRADLRGDLLPARRASALFPALAGGQGVRRRSRSPSSLPRRCSCAWSPRRCITALADRAKRPRQCAGRAGRRRRWSCRSAISCRRPT